MEPDDSKTPIGYRNADDDRPERRKNIGAFVQGMVVGILIVAGAGFVGFLGTWEIHPRGPNKRMHVASLCFGIFAIASGVIGINLLRSPRRYYFLAGVLMGAAVTSLIEGTCFFGA